MCQHRPACPDAQRPDGSAAHVAVSAAHVAVSHPEQGWSLLCNGVVLFDDAGKLLPDGRAIAPPPVGPMPMAACAAHTTG